MVVDIRGEKVRLGISADPSIPVHRQEVYEAIQRENERDRLCKSEVVIKVLAVRPNAKAHRYLDPQGKLAWAIMDANGPEFISRGFSSELPAWHSAFEKVSKS